MSLPPEVSDSAPRVALDKYGEVRDIQEENWSRAHRYPVASGTRIAMFNCSTTYPVTRSGGASDFDIVRGVPGDVLCVQRNRTPVSSVPASEESERIRKDGYHIMG